MQCPSCEKTLIRPADCELCGWSRATGSPDGRPPMPTMRDALAEIASQIDQCRLKRPAGMPDNLQDAARWMLSKVLERMQPEEAPALRSRDEGTKENTTRIWFWVWPYLTRIKTQTRQFLHVDAEFQRYIIAAKEDDIPWRGDEPWFFYRVVDEHHKMLRMGVAEYQKQSMRNLRIIMGEKTVKHD